MFWTTLVLLGLTIALWQFSLTCSDQVARFLGRIASVICFMAGLAIAPILLKSMIFCALLIRPILPHRRYGTYATWRPL